MPDQLQLRGGTTAEHSTFTGASKEVTVDTTKKTAVVHDGTTAGGVPVMREDASNSALALGSQGAPSLKFTGDTNTGIYSPGEDQLAISTGGTSRLHITSAGLVGIGTTSPGAPLSVNGNAIIGPESGTRLAVNLTENDKVELQVIDSTSTARAMAFTVGATEAARLTATGQLLVGTSDGSGGVSKLIVQGASNGSPVGVAQISYNGLASAGLGAGTDIGYLRFTDQGSNSGVFAQITATADATSGANDYPGRLVFSTTADGASSPTERMRITKEGASRFFCSTGADTIEASSAEAAGATRYLFLGSHSATGIGTGTNCYRVYTSGNVQNTNNSYGAISDAKLKENIVDANSQWDDIKALQVRNYNFKEGQTHTQIGLVAQEVEPISPGLVYESPDRDEDGNDLGTVTKSVNYSVLYMKAVKALQEAMDRIEVLEQRLTDAGID